MDTHMEKCPHCKEMVDSTASRCPHCHGKIYRWTTGRKVIGGIAVLILLIIIINPSSDSKNVTSAPATKPSIQQIAITEAQCEELKSEFYSVINGETPNKTQLGKELLEQYAADAGISIVKSNPNVRYVLPKSECGQNLDTAVSLLVEGAKNGGAN